MKSGLTWLRPILGVLILLPGLSLLPGAGLAAESGLQRLQAFSGEMHSLRANFIQTLFDANGRQIRESGGTLVLRRPGQFRWDYEHPFAQQIIADGEKLWVYDAELEQVTVRPQDGALGQAPIMLLSEARPLDADFETRDLGAREGLEWVELKPRVQDTDFRVIYLGLDEQGLKVMELRDHFEQVTQIRLDQVRYNAATDPAEFAFEPPPGVDVIGESLR